MKVNPNDIPVLMKKLRIDERGYPVPYFTPMIEGKPDFRFSNMAAKKVCRQFMKCWVCGNQLFAKSFWFITGPMGLKNKVASDEAMHEDCARFSLKYCPHIAYEKAERRTGEFTASITQLTHKPAEVFLIKSDQVKFISQLHTQFRPVLIEKYIYKDNRLTPAP